jgi:thiamine kinase-like enzyme
MNESDFRNMLCEATNRIEFLRGVDTSNAVRLGGLTNINYRVDHNGESFVVRMPGAKTDEFINREAEEFAAVSAAAAGVNTDVLFFAVDGLMVTRFVANSMTMNSSRFRDHGAVARAGRLIRQLHQNAERFKSEFNVFSLIDSYKSNLDRKSSPMPARYEEAVPLVAATREALGSMVVALVPSHCDPLCENFLDTGERMFLIDFEYAGNTDPMWDLADLSVEAGFNRIQDQRLLEAYFGGVPKAADVGRMVAFKAMCDVLWALWGKVQDVNGNQAEDFARYADHRLSRALNLMQGSTYQSHLAATTSS